MKKIAIILALALMLTSCGGTSAESSTSSESTEASTSTASGSEEGEEESSTATLTEEDEALLAKFFEGDVVTDGGWEAGEFPQLAETQDESLPRVKMTTSMGDITMVLYPSAAPLAVENFITHCEDGYYDGVLFHRVIEDFMIQSGDPNGDGTGGTSIYSSGTFANESCDNLHHFNGALAMANAGPNTNGSQFFIVQADTMISEDNLESVMFYWYYNELNTRLYSINVDDYTEETGEQLVDALNILLTQASENGVPEEYRERYLPAARAYIEHGGYPLLDYGYTVFGQVIDGMDVVNAIAAVEVQENSSGEKSSPVEPVTIVSTTVISK